MFQKYGTTRTEGEGYCSVVINQPEKALPDGTKGQLVLAIVNLISTTFGTKFAEKEVYSSTIAGEHRKLALLLKENQLMGFISGQALNEQGYLFMHENKTVFHISSAHCLPVKVHSAAHALTTRVLDTFTDRPTHVSGFTQSPRIYELMSKLTTEIIPSPFTLTSVLHEKAMKVFHYPNIDNSVFRGKGKHNFYLEVPKARNEDINHWWYEDLKVKPEEGDLLFMIAKYEDRH